MDEINAGWTPMSGDQLQPYEVYVNQVIMGVASRGVLTSYRTETTEEHGGSLLRLIGKPWSSIEAVAMRFGADRFNSKAVADVKEYGLAQPSKFLGTVRDVAQRVILAMHYVKEHGALEPVSEDGINRTMMELSSRGVLTRFREELLRLDAAKGLVYRGADGVDSCLRRGWAGLYQNMARKWDRIGVVNADARANQSALREAEADGASHLETLYVTLRDLLAYCLHTMRWAEAQVDLARAGELEVERAPVSILEDRVALLRNARENQTKPGVWDNNPYAFGIANGLILAESIMDGQKQVPFLRPPEHWADYHIIAEDEQIEPEGDGDGEQAEEGQEQPG